MSLSRSLCTLLLVALVACDKGVPPPSGLYSEDDLLALSDQVFAATKEGTATCQKYPPKLDVDPVIEEAMSHAPSEAIVRLMSNVTMYRQPEFVTCDIRAAMQTAFAVQKLAGAATRTLRSLSREELTDIAAQLDKTIPLEPAFGQTMFGQLWRLETKHVVDKNENIDVRGLFVEALLVTRTLLPDTCPPTASLSACFHGFEKAGTDGLQTDKLLESRQADIKKAKSDDARHALQRELAREHAFHQLSRFGKYVVRRTQSLTHLIALRLSVQVHLDGHCPATVDDPVYAKLAAPDVLGDKVTLELRDHGLFVLPPAWAVHDEGTTFEPLGIPCP